MIEEKLNSPFDIPIEQIEDMIGMAINGDLSGYDRVISPRALKDITNITYFRGDIFEALIRKISLRDRTNGIIYPYENSKIRVFEREPKGFEIGQTFIMSSKILSIMNNLERVVFGRFVTKGISKMPPAQIYGIDREGKKAVAFYIPPLVEVHGDNAVLIDGIHRSYICGSVGTTINAIHICNVGVKLPFDPLEWENASLMDEKPPIEKRYVNLNQDLFRDLGAIGVDG